ncbi:hypothetical protein CLV59_102340 [Chitinophaga dinghuensis]|uniref:Uncharacterized protein n=1 Tax=Chitinophaga dinghuensis TaxID=1539050 RepID=A0A327W5E7_9BACT|nr:hypothetical protein [Chitinophaga dinghuensis]RAJ85635.1 hypothetical protein CLV59_102340 [Chitinophaga dinghuensis]
MNIKTYIESGIIEKYVLGLATPEQEAEFHYLREIYPMLNVEMEMVELRLENLLFEEAVLPPDHLKDRVLDRIGRDQPKWQERVYSNGNGHTNKEPEYISIKPGWNRQITVSIWWRCAFIAMVVLTMALLASTWYLHNQVEHLQDVLIRNNFTPHPISR